MALIDQLKQAYEQTKADLKPSPVGPCDHVFMLERSSAGELEAAFEGMCEKIEAQGYKTVNRVNYGPVSRMIKRKPTTIWVFYVEVSK